MVMVAVPLLGDEERAAFRKSPWPVPVAELNVDPFTRVHRALFEKLAAQPRFAALVKLANRIDYAGGLEDPERGAPAASDLIEATLVPAGATPGTWRTRDTFVSDADFDDYDIRRYDAQILALRRDLMELGMTFQ